MARLERLHRAVLPGALRAALRAFRFAPGESVELLGFARSLNLRQSHHP